MPDKGSEIQQDRSGGYYSNHSVYRLKGISRRVKNDAPDRTVWKKERPWHQANDENGRAYMAYLEKLREGG